MYREIDVRDRYHSWRSPEDRSLAFDHRRKKTVHTVKIGTSAEAPVRVEQG